MPVIKRFQTIADFATQHAGTMEALFDVALQNGIGITDDVAPGTEFQAVLAEKKVVSFYLVNKELDILTKIGKQPIPGGIGYMQISTSFIVS